MTPETHARLTRWLESGNRVQKKHAEYSLAKHEGRALDPPAPRLTPLRDSMRAAKLGFRKCLYSSHKGCGCTGTRCFWKGRIVGLKDCVACVNETLAAPGSGSPAAHSAGPAAGRPD